MSSVAQKTQNFLSTRQRDYLINPARLQGPSLLAWVTGQLKHFCALLFANPRPNVHSLSLSIVSLSLEDGNFDG